MVICRLHGYVSDIHTSLGTQAVARTPAYGRKTVPEASASRPQPDDDRAGVVLRANVREGTEQQGPVFTSI